MVPVGVGIVLNFFFRMWSEREF